MVVDTSALVAVLFEEPERHELIELLAAAEDPLISAATLVEASIVMQARTGDEGVADLDALLGASSVRCIAVDVAQGHVARAAFERYGKGRAPAGLNIGDCFPYALAKARRALAVVTGLTWPGSACCAPPGAAGRRR